MTLNSMHSNEVVRLAEELYSSLPETLVHQRQLALILRTEARLACDDAVEPPWVKHFDRALELIVVALLTTGYIFRSQRTTGMLTVSSAIGYAVQARQVLLTKLKEGKTALRWGNKNFTLTDGNDND